MATTLNIKPCHVAELLILTCSDFDDLSAKLTLIYEDGIKEIPIRISNFGEGTPMYGDKIALDVKKVKKTSNIPLVDDRIYHINLYDYKTDFKNSLVGMKLPNCPNIHIFGIMVRCCKQLELL